MADQPAHQPHRLGICKPSSPWPTPPSEAGWDGDMRHLPIAHPWPHHALPRVKRDNNGDTFVITTDTDSIDALTTTAKATPRLIGAWAPDETDGPDAPAF